MRDVGDDPTQSEISSYMAPQALRRTQSSPVPSLRFLFRYFSLPPYCTTVNLISYYNVNPIPYQCHPSQSAHATARDLPWDGTSSGRCASHNTLVSPPPRPNALSPSYRVSNVRSSPRSLLWFTQPSKRPNEYPTTRTSQQRILADSPRVTLACFRYYCLSERRASQPATTDSTRRWSIRICIRTGSL
ncbi:hypothetical protein ACRALDRAFT_209896 [Sodiomyces alcalophilus JCM 7366]|uniref:uncharacterized protein n=1 Tax=Sodiomyces alcalophilus JCM 7366 TaxID=591952 RepID=UPI0039B4EC03